MKRLLILLAAAALFLCGCRKENIQPEGTPATSWPMMEMPSRNPMLY